MIPTIMLLPNLYLNLDLDEQLFIAGCACRESFSRNQMDIADNKEEIVAEIDAIIDSFFDEPSALDDPLVVHARPPEDGHYPFTELRKKRTRMRSGVCVWCAIIELMKHPARPKLQFRQSGNEANWENWLRELDSPRREFLPYLVESLLPMKEVLRFVSKSEIRLFYRDIAGALIELALREFRGLELDDRSLMAQVRSSKHHKTVRVAGIIEGAYR